MAEPILGQALALQSEFRPDTTQVLTKAVSKIGDVTLKKQLAEAKAAETKAKRLQEIMGAVKLEGAKVNRHFLPEAQRRYAEGIAQMQESAMKGDIMGVNNLKGQLEMEFNNLSEQSKALDNFLSLKKQGFYISPEIEAAFAMPKAEGQAYLKKVYEQKPELKGLVDVNEYGDYVFNPIKDLDLQADFRDVVTKNELLFKPTGQKVVDETAKDQLELYKIPKENIQEFALLKSQDPEIKANIILKDKAGFATYVNQVKTANPNATPEQIENTALVSYIGDKLEKINEKTVKSNIPQGKGGLDMNFGSGFKTQSGWIVTPTSGRRVKEEDPTLTERLRVLNIARRKAGQNKLTYQEAYGTPEADYDEIYFENKDVPENKTFKVPDGKGGFFDMIPVAVRRQSGVDKNTKKDFPWKLSGRIPKTEDEDERNISVELTPDVIAKLDGILGASTQEIISQVQGTKKSSNVTIRKGPPAPATQPKKTIKASEIAAKAKAAGYTDSEYRKLLKDKGVNII
jgi:hypothetical protein